MSARQITYNWEPSANGISWHKNRGTYREEVVGPCLNREDGLYYIRRKNRDPFSFGHVREYEWGRFEPPIFENGQPVFPGSFSKTSMAMEENWNRCWQDPVILETEQPQTETTEIIDTVDETDYFTDQFTQFTQSDVKTNLITAAVAIVVITALTYIALR